MQFMPHLCHILGVFEIFLGEKCGLKSEGAKRKKWWFRTSLKTMKFTNIK